MKSKERLFCMQIIDFKINPSALEVEGFDLTDIQIGNKIDMERDYYISESEVKQEEIYENSVGEILLDVKIKYMMSVESFEEYFGIDILRYIKNYKFDCYDRRTLGSILDEITPSMIRDTSIEIYIDYYNVSYNIEQNKSYEVDKLTNYSAIAYASVGSSFSENSYPINNMLTRLIRDLEIWKPLIINFENKLKNNTLISLIVKEEIDDNEFIKKVNFIREQKEKCILDLKKKIKNLGVVFKVKSERDGLIDSFMNKYITFNNNYHGYNDVCYCRKNYGDYKALSLRPSILIFDDDTDDSTFNAKETFENFTSGEVDSRIWVHWINDELYESIISNLKNGYKIPIHIYNNVNESYELLKEYDLVNDLIETAIWQDESHVQDLVNSFKEYVPKEALID